MVEAVHVRLEDVHHDRAAIGVPARREHVLVRFDERVAGAEAAEESLRGEIAGSTQTVCAIPLVRTTAAPYPDAEAREVADEQFVVADGNATEGMTRLGHQPRVQRPGLVPVR